MSSHTRLPTAYSFGTIGVAVGVFVGVEVGVLVTIGVGVGVVVGVPVTIGVAVGVLVGVSVGVAVGVLVGVLVGVSVGVAVGVLVGVVVGVVVTEPCHSFEAVAVSVSTVELGTPKGCFVVGFACSTYSTDLGTVTTAEAVMLAVPGRLLVIVNFAWPLASVVTVAWPTCPKVDVTLTGIPETAKPPLVRVTVIWCADCAGS
jgi:hypothetical protein